MSFGNAVSKDCWNQSAFSFFINSFQRPRLCPAMLSPLPRPAQSCPVLPSPALLCPAQFHYAQFCPELPSPAEPCSVLMTSAQSWHPCPDLPRIAQPCFIMPSIVWSCPTLPCPAKPCSNQIMFCSILPGEPRKSSQPYLA